MKSYYRKTYFVLVIALIVSLTLGACSGSREKSMYKVGVVNLAGAFDPILEGFKAGMEEEGFFEGQNIIYIYDGPASNPDALDAVLENLKKQKVDVVLTFGTTATLKAKTLLEGTDIAIIFGPVTDPVASGIVTDLFNPEGHITGIRTGNPTPKRLEWLMKMNPDIKKLYVFNNPKDNSSTQALAALTETAEAFNVKLVVRDASTPEEIDAGLSAIPEDVDAIFIPASAFFESQMDKFITVAKKKRLPLAAPATANVWSGALTSLGHDNVPLGRQASRLAVQILRGVEPADLPVETSDLFLSVNLHTAATIGLPIPDEIIRQADITVR